MAFEDIGFLLKGAAGKGRVSLQAPAMGDAEVADRIARCEPVARSNSVHAYLPLPLGEIDACRSATGAEVVLVGLTVTNCVSICKSYAVECLVVRLVSGSTAGVIMVRSKCVLAWENNASECSCSKAKD